MTSLRLVRSTPHIAVLPCIAGCFWKSTRHLRPPVGHGTCRGRLIRCAAQGTFGKRHVWGHRIALGLRALPCRQRLPLRASMVLPLRCRTGLFFSKPFFCFSQFCLYCFQLLALGRECLFPVKSQLKASLACLFRQRTSVPQTELAHRDFCR